MTHTLRGAAEALRRTAEELGDAGARTATLDPGPRAFGADGPGALGALGRDLHALVGRALEARAREAVVHAARLAAAAEAVARAGGGYAEVDDASRSRHPEVR
jgi:hypothetical protein